jgi:6-phosphogluconolactonase/glucosamine-6-phosphate isomerase/deaminase
MIKKIDEYVQVPFSSANSNVSYARQYLNEPDKDPLFYETDRLEEHKKLSSQFTSDTILNLQGSGHTH